VHRGCACTRGLADECGFEGRDHVAVTAGLECGGGGLERGVDLHHLDLVRARREDRALGLRERESGELVELLRGLGALVRFE
jgi:hypothetical protein